MLINPTERWQKVLAVNWQNLKYFVNLGVRQLRYSFPGLCTVLLRNKLWDERFHRERFISAFVTHLFVRTFKYLKPCHIFLAPASLTPPFLISCGVLLLLTFRYLRDWKSVSGWADGRLVKFGAGKDGALHTLLNANKKCFRAWSLQKEKLGGSGVSKRSGGGELIW